MRKSFLYKWSFLIVLLLYVFIIEINPVVMKIDAIVTLLCSFFFLLKARSNKIVVIVSFYVFYCIYSIVMGEYIIGGDLGVPMKAVKTVEIYGLTIRTLLIFMVTIMLFYKSQKLEHLKINLKSNGLIYSVMILILIYSIIFGVNRHGDLSIYSVRISPIYEYSTILFLFAYYYSGKSYIKKILLLLLGLIFILQDLYYGGRITSLQIILFFSYTLFSEFINFKNILVFGSMGIFLNSFVGAFRNAREIGEDFFSEVFHRVIDSYLVFDTPVYAYYASATHVATSEIVNVKERLTALFAFISSVFFGTDIQIGNLSDYINDKYFINIGGGVASSFFYFWLGWIGVILGGLFVAKMLNRFTDGNNDYNNLLALIFAITVPRWFTYNPLLMFRPLLFTSILYFALAWIHNSLIKKKYW